MDSGQGGAKGEQTGKHRGREGEKVAVEIVERARGKDLSSSNAATRLATRLALTRQRNMKNRHQKTIGIARNYKVERERERKRSLRARERKRGCV